MSRRPAPSSPPQPLPAGYWRLWTASTISNLGDGVLITALPLYAARLTRDEASLSLVVVALSLPWLLFALPIGAIVDRHSRVRLMVTADLLRAAVIGGAAVLAAVGELHIWMLWVMAFVMGIGEVVFDNASQAMLPSLVSTEQLPRANGWKYSADTTANLFVGTPLGGVVLTVAVWLPFGVDAASFLIAAAIVATLGRAAQPAGTASPARPSSSLRADTAEGFRWLWRHPVLRSLAMATGLANLGFQMPNALFVLYAQDDIGIDDDRWVAFVIGCMGAGAVLGGLIGDRLVSRTGRTFAIYSAIALWVASLLTYAVLPVAWVIVAVSVLQSFAVTVWNVATVSLRQTLVPDSISGRVNSVYRWFGWGSISVGALIGGQVAGAVGLRPTYAIGAAVVACAALVTAPHIRPAKLARLVAAADADRTASARAVDPTPLAIDREPW